MSAMTLVLLDGARVTRFDDLVDVVATDASGSFGVRPGHEALVTVLAPGIVACRFADGRARYVACAGGVFRCSRNLLQIVSARFIEEKDAALLTAQLDREVQGERAMRSSTRQSRLNLERALMRRLREWSEHAHDAT
jgi:F-type H+-transporting ATPase subunit epsilon